MSKNLSGKVIVVTGGGRGLGEWMAQGFSEVGAHVVVAGNNLDECERVVTNIKTKHGSAIACEMDVTRIEDIRSVLELTLKEFGKVDVLINNAGNVGRKKALDVDEEFFDQMNAVNVKGAFFCAQTFGEQMIKQGKGKIINITSAAGKLIRKGLANPIYSMNKGAINTMTKALAEEWSSYHISVNAIGPGYFATPPVKERLQIPETYQSVIESTPLGKIGEAPDIIGASQFLASDDSDFITGQILHVDGGRTIL